MTSDPIDPRLTLVCLWVSLAIDFRHRPLDENTPPTKITYLLTPDWMDGSSASTVTYRCFSPRIGATFLFLPSPVQSCALLFFAPGTPTSIHQPHGFLRRYSSRDCQSSHVCCTCRPPRLTKSPIQYNISMAQRLVKVDIVPDPNCVVPRA
jgi:hypothetical protein